MSRYSSDTVQVLPVLWFFHKSQNHCAEYRHHPTSTLSALRLPTVANLQPTTMFNMINLVAFTIAAFAGLSAALPQVLPSGGQCNTGALHCCNSVQEADSESSTEFFSIMGMGDLIGSSGQVGFACSPAVSDTGLSGNFACSQQAACCEDTQFSTCLALSIVVIFADDMFSCRRSHRYGLHFPADCCSCLRFFLLGLKHSKWSWCWPCCCCSWRSSAQVSLSIHIPFS
ncbi:hypothetical protein HGRIS_009311 [Hohenbuehelia grisea]|uniref:Hydrophobin n=1 Tax=Hohenbuehelia grisea TaxID=104357 RepID=A0ABR3J0W2_9AGAR